MNNLSTVADKSDELRAIRDARSTGSSPPAGYHQAKTLPLAELVRAEINVLVKPLGGNSLNGARVWAGIGPLIRERWRLVGAALLGSSVAAILAFSAPAHFESTVQMMIPTQGANSISVDFGASAVLQALLIQIMESRTVQDRIIDRFNLKNAYGASLQETARVVLAQHTRFQENPYSGVTGVTVTDKNGQRAADICNAYAEELNRRITELTTSTARQERHFLETRLDLSKPILDSSGKSLAEFSSKNNMMDATDLGGLLTASRIFLIRNLGAEESQLSELRETYASHNPQVRESAARVQKLSRDLQELQGYPNQSSDVPPGAWERSYPSLRTLPVLGVTYSNLSTRFHNEENLYINLVMAAEQARFQEENETPILRILDYGTVSRGKSSPPRFLMIVGGGSLFFIIGCAWIICQPGIDKFRGMLAACPRD